MNLERRFSLMDRRLKMINELPDRSPRRGRNPYNQKVIHGPMYMIDYVDEKSEQIRKFDFSVLSAKGYPGMKILGANKLQFTKRTNDCRPKQDEDVVLKWD